MHKRLSNRSHNRRTADGSAAWRVTAVISALLFVQPVSAAVADGSVASLRIEPEAAFIQGVGNSHALLFTAVEADGTSRDVTEEVNVSFDVPGLLRQASPGVFESLGEGIVKIHAVYEGQDADAVVIIQPKKTAGLDFAVDVAPVFSRYGCNNTNCHGAMNGQSGFKLSLFGYDPDADYEAVVHASDGRRINAAEPEKSLLLQKPTFQIPHGGGQLIEKDSLDYRTLVDWISTGMPQSAKDSPRLQGIEVFPQGFQTIPAAGKAQRIVVVGRYTDGSRRDVTRRVRYATEDDTVLKVDSSGRVEALEVGEGTVLIRTLGQVAALRFGVATGNPVPKAGLQPANFIDELVAAKLRAMRIESAGLSTDAEFVRRAYLDVLGILPTVEEARSFLADTSVDKRTRLIDQLLERPEYADYWAAKWGDLFANSVLTSSDGTAYMQDWLRAAFRENKPYDEFVTEILTSTGSTWEVGAVSYFSRSTEDLVTLTAQAFLGLSLECARCHDHPSANWKREDFVATAAFFSQLAGKGLRPPPVESISYLKYDQEYRHPETKQVVKPRFLDGVEPLIRPLEDRRAVLARWITSPDNPWFARATVNRIWNQFMGRALVDPVDDFRSTNPATNAELLNRLAADFAENGFDLHHLMRLIMTSNTYQLSSRPNPASRTDDINYSRFYLKRLTAEQLMDSIVQVTGAPQDYLGYYPGVRAVNLADPGVPSSFLDMFDRPKRDAAKCERNESVSLRQAMHLLVGDTLNRKLQESSEKGEIARLLKDGKSDAEIVEHFYLAALARYPEAEEKDYCLSVISKADEHARGLRNAVWAILSTNEFLYNH